MVLVCYSLCSGMPIASAENEADNEVSTNRPAEFSTLPYLEYLGRSRVQPGSLVLHISPRDSHVYLDGRTFEELKQHGVVIVRRDDNKASFLTLKNLIPGTHTLRATKSSYSTRLRYIHIEPGSTSSISIKLHNRWRFFAAEILMLASLVSMSIAVSILI